MSYTCAERAPCHIVVSVVVGIPGPITALSWSGQLRRPQLCTQLRPDHLLGQTETERPLDWWWRGQDVTEGGEVRGRSKLVSNWSPAEAWTWTPVKLEQLKIESTEQSLHSNTRLGREGEFKLDSSLRNINIQRVKLWCNLMWEENVKMFTIIWFL